MRDMVRCVESPGFETVPDDTLPMAAMGRTLCSHLAEVWAVGEAGPAETALLEEIDAAGAALSTQREYVVGRRLVVEARGGPAMPAEVRRVERREDGVLVEVEFRDGFRWDRDRWTPDHALAAEKASAARRSGS